MTIGGIVTSVTGGMIVRSECGTEIKHKLISNISAGDKVWIHYDRQGNVTSIEAKCSKCFEIGKEPQDRVKEETPFIDYSQLDSDER
jgi:uncharacterized protein YuzE